MIDFKHKYNKMKKNRLPIQQLDQKMAAFQKLGNITMPSIGWIRSIRLTLGISMEQIAKKLSISKQNVSYLEKREKDGLITIKSLKELGNALDMDLVYGFIPKDGTLENLIDRKAKDVATQIVLRTSNTMKLEEQEVSYQRLEKAIEERTAELKNEVSKLLWD